MDDGIEVVEIRDEDDGSATIVMNLSYENLITFAKIGVLKVLTDEAKKVLENEQE